LLGEAVESTGGSHFGVRIQKMEKSSFLRNQLFLQPIERAHWATISTQYRTEGIITGAFCEFYECFGGKHGVIGGDSAVKDLSRRLIFGANRISLMSLKVSISVATQDGAPSGDTAVPFLLFEIDGELFLVDHTLISGMSKPVNAALPAIWISFPGIVMTWCFSAEAGSGSPENLSNNSCDYYVTMLREATAAMNSSLQCSVYSFPTISIAGVDVETPHEFEYCSGRISSGNTAGGSGPAPSGATGHSIPEISMELQLAQSSVIVSDGGAPKKRRRIADDDNINELVGSLTALQRFIEQSCGLISREVSLDAVTDAFFDVTAAVGDGKYFGKGMAPAGEFSFSPVAPSGLRVGGDILNESQVTAFNDLPENFMAATLAPSTAHFLKRSHEEAVLSCEKNIQNHLCRLFAPVRTNLAVELDKVYLHSC
jgi:hypothetical protein